MKKETKLMKVKKFKNLNDKQIENIENRFKVNLPAEYKSFLKQVGGGVAEKDESNQITLDEINESIVLDVLYGDDENEKGNIIFWMEQFEGELLKDAIIIGDDLLQGFIVMICKGESQGIYYWDDSCNFECSDDENNMYWIADTFGEFLNLVNIEER